MPEASQHCCQQALGLWWAWVLMLINLEEAFQNGTYQYRCPHCRMSSIHPKMDVTHVCMPRVSSSCPDTVGDAPRSAGRFDPGSFQITPSALGPRVCEDLCAPFRNGVSVSHSPQALPEMSPTGLQSQMLWRLFFLEQDAWGREPDMGFRPLTPWGEPLQL